MKARLRLIIFCFGSACATHSPAPNADPSQTGTTPAPEREGLVDLRGIWGPHDSLMPEAPESEVSTPPS